MNQLLLDLGPAPQPTLENFIVGRNAEALAVLRRLCAAPVADPPARCLYLWGEAGSGRSHLLRAACALLGGRYLSASAIAAASVAADDVRGAMTCASSQARCLLAIDDVEETGAEVQEALFHALNAMREDPRAAIVVAGNAAPRDLALVPGRDDLRSRLAWGLAFELHGLDDAAKDAALARIGKAHGKTAAQVCLRWLVQQGVTAIPRTSKAERLKENLAVFDFEFTEAEIREIAALAQRDGRLVDYAYSGSPQWD